MLAVCGLGCSVVQERSVGGCGAVNAALTVFAASMVTWQVPVPEQAPVQPVNVELVSGFAVNVTRVLTAKSKEQVAPQLMPAGLLETVPEPVPLFVTVKVKALIAKVAWTDLAASMVTWHVPLPVQAPLQPVKEDPASAVAVSVTGML